MPRYVAFLRAVSPMNAKMPELKRAFERAGFTDVRTLLSSGNVVFNARTASRATLERKAEIAMKKALGRAFDTFIRSQDELTTLLEKDPFAAYHLPKDAKRVVSFVRTRPKLKLPPEVDGARMLAVKGGEVLTAYVPSPRGPVFMRLIDKTFGKEVTTRTWDTVRKCAAA
jgi:uncharacterized protein (DUF1697 family)